MLVVELLAHRASLALELLGSEVRRDLDEMLLANKRSSGDTRSFGAPRPLPITCAFVTDTAPSRVASATGYIHGVSFSGAIAVPTSTKLACLDTG